MRKEFKPENVRQMSVKLDHTVRYSQGRTGAGLQTYRQRISK